MHILILTHKRIYQYTNVIISKKVRICKALFPIP
nr:MAG TPA_asm: hypothetical protein [Caudoviricetes sp.]